MMMLKGLSMDRYPRPLWYVHRDGYGMMGSPDAAAEALQKETREKDRAAFIEKRTRQERRDTDERRKRFSRGL